MQIIVNNHKSQLICGAKDLDAIRKLMRIRAKNAWYSPAYRNNSWDGYINYISDRTGIFDTGLLDKVVKHINKDLVKDVKIIDRREKFKDLHEVNEVGGKVLRPDQKAAIHAFLNHKIAGIKFPRGIMYEATNYGKTVLTAGIVESFSEKRTGVYLINNKTIYNQAVEDFKELLGKDQVGWIRSGSVKLARFNICMVQTLGNLIARDPKIRTFLSKVDIFIIDEYDEVIGFKSTKKTLELAYNAPIRLGLTGTALMSKDKNKNQEQLKFTGPVIHKTTNKELVDLGVSAKPTIKFFMGNKRLIEDLSYQQEYDKCVIRSISRNKKIWKLVGKAAKKGQVLVLFKYHKHLKYLLKHLPVKLKDKYRIGIAHGKLKNRESTIKKFNDGKYEILICSMIIRRGKNIPGIRVLINIAGGDSEAGVLQIFGRSLRKSKTKTKVDMWEMYDRGKYLEKHSKHRVRYYKNQKFPVNELYKRALLNQIIINGKKSKR